MSNRKEKANQKKEKQKWRRNEKGQKISERKRKVNPKALHTGVFGQWSFFPGPGIQQFWGWGLSHT